MKKLDHIGIVAFKERTKIKKTIRNFYEWANREGLSIYFHNEISSIAPAGAPVLKNFLFFKKANVLFSFGGDGTLLSAARLVGKQNIPILGINLGKRGFLTDVKAENMEQAVGRILQGNYRIDERMMLDVKVTRDDRTVFSDFVLNDAVVRENGIGKLINIAAFINNRLVCRYTGDGLITATPTGSTAYSLAAAGPILYPGLEVVILNPICPHTLQQRPIIYSARQKLVLEIEPKMMVSIVLICDGKIKFNLKTGDRVHIEKSKYLTRLIRPLDVDFFKTLRDKLSWGI